MRCRRSRGFSTRCCWPSLAPPVDSDLRGELFLARIDKLLDLGALDPALALLEQIETPQAEPFRRWFDIALLTGQEDRACEVMRATPSVAPTFPARVFCLARGGDWNAAALSLRTGETLGYIDADMSALLERFLDPELFEGEPDLPMPARPSPLVLRLMEAIGQPLPTTTLPVAFAQADLRSNSGWKTRLEAGERLARSGAIEPNRLLGLYTERKAAASGGVWERVSAIQAFDAALSAGETGAIARTLPAAWQQMTGVELEVPFAALYGVSAVVARPARRRRVACLPHRAPLRGLRGSRPVPNAGDCGGTLPDRAGRWAKAPARRRPIRWAPRSMRPSRPKAGCRPISPTLLAENRLGEALLLTIDRITEGARGDLRGITDGLRLLRQARSRIHRAPHRPGTRAPRAAGLRQWRRRTGDGALDLGLSRGTGGRTRRGAQHASRLWPRPEGFRRVAVAEIEGFCRRDPSRCRGLSRRLRGRGAVARHPGAPSFLDPPALPLRLRGRLARRQSGDPDHRTRPGETPAESAERRGGRPASCREPRERARRLRAAAQHLPDGASLRDRHAGERACRPARRGRAGRSADAAGQGQGRQGADGAALLPCPRGARRMACRPRCRRGSGAGRGAHSAPAATFFPRADARGT